MSDVQARLRALPAVDVLANTLADGNGRAAPTRAETLAAARAALAERREELIAGAHDDADLVERARAHLRPSLRRVLNATGVVVHTNLGRAPLPAAALDAIAEGSRGYANLEIDLATGRRGSRDEHVRALLRELTGAEDALVVNNGAGAALLAVAALAGDGSAIAVSRGQLVEIGGGFRIPDVLEHAGARMVEVGTTNRTRLDDYERALAEEGAAAILRVHQSNFRTIGFVEDVAIEPLCGLGVPVIDDLGSGALAEGVAALAEEPAVRRSVRAGAALVCFSGDKLLGGPQAGILVGRADAIAASRRHPLARALRVGRLPLTALAATLALYRDPERVAREVPVLAMLTVERETLVSRATRLAAAATGPADGAVGAEVIESVGHVGGGALPLLELAGPAVALAVPGVAPEVLAACLRDCEPPLIARISEGRVIVDPRTLADEEVELAAALVREVVVAAAREPARAHDAR